MFFFGRVLVSVLGKSCPLVSSELFEGPEGLDGFEGVGEGFDFGRLPWCVPNADAWISETTSFIPCMKLITELACSCVVAGKNPPVSNSSGCDAGRRAVISVAASEYQSWFTTSMDPSAIDKPVSVFRPCTLYPIIPFPSGCKGTLSSFSCYWPICYQPYPFPVLVLYPIGYHVLFHCFVLKPIPLGAI